MLSKCANPTCSTPFVYLRDGKIFLRKHTMDPSQAHGPAASQVARLEYFWLCGPCSEEFTLVDDPAVGTRVVWKKKKTSQAAA
jgi:hypothetical protein